MDRKAAVAISAVDRRRIRVGRKIRNDGIWKRPASGTEGGNEADELREWGLEMIRSFSTLLLSPHRGDVRRSESRDSHRIM